MPRSGERRANRYEQDLSPADRMALALTIAGEVDPNHGGAPYGTPGNRGEIANILQTVDNRSKASGKTRAQTVHERSQYSTWNNEKSKRNAKASYSIYGPDIERAMRDYYGGTLPPSNTRLTNYYNNSLVSPPWAKNLEPLAQVNQHLFLAPPLDTAALDAQREMQTARARLGPPPAPPAGPLGDIFAGPPPQTPLGPPPGAGVDPDMKRAQIGALAAGMIAKHPEAAGQIMQQMAAAGLNIDGSPLSKPPGLTGTAIPGPPPPSASAEVGTLTPEHQPVPDFSAMPTGYGMPPSGAATANRAVPPFNNALVPRPVPTTSMPPAPPGAPDQTLAMGGQRPFPPVTPDMIRMPSPVTPASRIAGAFPNGPPASVPPALLAAAQQAAGKVQIGPGTATPSPPPPSASATGQLPVSPDARISGAFQAAGAAPPVPAGLAAALAGLSPGPSPIVPGAVTGSAPPPSASALGSPQITPPLNLSGTAAFGPPPGATASGQLPAGLQSPFSPEATASASPQERMAATMRAPLSATPLSLPPGMASGSFPPASPTAGAQQPLAAPPMNLSGQAMPLGAPPGVSAAARGPLPTFPGIQNASMMAGPPPNAMASANRPIPVNQPPMALAPRPVPTTSIMAPPSNIDRTMQLGALNSPPGMPLGSPPTAMGLDPSEAARETARAKALSSLPTIAPPAPPAPPSIPQPSSAPQPSMISSLFTKAQELAPAAISGVKEIGEKALKSAIGTWAGAGPTERAKIAGAAGPASFWSGLETGGLGPTDIARASLMAARLYGPGGPLANGAGWNGGNSNGWGGGGYQGGTYGGFGGSGIGQGTGGAYRNR